MQSPSVPVVKDLVLVGGGHAHVSVLRRFGMRPMPGVRLTLVTRDIHTPYSGMLPGHVAGHYDYDDCHIDLGPLARFAGARLYHASVEALDLDNRQVIAAGRPPIGFDLLSVNTGSRPRTAGIPGALEFAMPVKPIDVWLQHWQALQQRLLHSVGDFHVVVVGGGAGGVELALSTHYRLSALLREHGDDPGRLHFALLSDDETILATHNPGVRRRFERVLGERGIVLRTAHRVEAVTADAVEVSGHGPRPADAVLWVTRAAAPDWLGAAGLAVDDEGFVQVNEYLQSVSHPQVFAAGDIASMADPRPKSGVFAVRQGPVLAANLRRACSGRPLKRYRPQRAFLGLISTGDRYAVASRGRWSAEGRWLWHLKDWIDRRFMQRFNELPAMEPDARPAYAQGVADTLGAEDLAAPVMRCGGCGAKIGSGVLANVIRRLPQQACDDLLVGLDAADDAAVLRVPDGKLMVQSVDYFRAFVDDPYVFGRIAANHALGDLFAMGAAPHSVLAIATVPYGAERVVENTLFELMMGAYEEVHEVGAVLAGGHSGEGAELAFGLTANGLVDADSLLRKSGLQPGDALILTKPIGTGTLLAADMRGLAKGRWVDAAITSMLLSNRSAVPCLRDAGASACTDVTGFGLLGHLFEMIAASGVDADLMIDRVPLLEGAMETAAMGVLSSLQPHNARLRRALQDLPAASRHPRYPLLFDPQTAGGLLAGVPPEQARTCIDALRHAGFPLAAVIGHVLPGSGGGQPLRIRSGAAVSA